MIYETWLALIRDRVIPVFAGQVADKEKVRFLSAQRRIDYHTDKYQE